jgi:hypothetical protein
VDIATADTTCVNLDVDVVVLERSRSVRVLLQGEGVALGLERGVAGELFGDGDVGHGGRMRVGEMGTLQYKGSLECYIRMQFMKSPRRLHLENPT